MGLLFSILCIFSLSILAFISYEGAKKLNLQKKSYMEKNIEILSLNIHAYLKKKIKNKKKPKSSTLYKMLSAFDSSKEGESIFLINSSGHLMAHTEKHLIGKTLPLKSPSLLWLKSIVEAKDSYHNHYLFFSNQVHSKRQNNFLKKPQKKGTTNFLMPSFFPTPDPKVLLANVSNHKLSPPMIRLVKQFFVYDTPFYLIIEEGLYKSFGSFLSYLPFTLISMLICFSLILLSFFYMYRSPLRVGEFFYDLFYRSKKPPTLKKTLSYLSHTTNPYLKSLSKNIKNRLIADKPFVSPFLLSHKKEPMFSDMLNKAYQRGKIQFPNTQFKIQCTKDLPLPVFSEQVFQALWELIKNSCEALSYNEISLSTFHKDTWFCCQIQDKGPGMHQSVLSKAGRLFFTTKKKATGLGLIFVQKVLLRFGGMVKLKSSPGQGLTARLFIPLDYIYYTQKLGQWPASSPPSSPATPQTKVAEKVS